MSLVRIRFQLEQVGWEWEPVQTFSVRSTLYFFHCSRQVVLILVV